MTLEEQRQEGARDGSLLSARVPKPGEIWTHVATATDYLFVAHDECPDDPTYLRNDTLFLPCRVVDESQVFPYTANEEVIAEHWALKLAVGYCGDCGQTFGMTTADYLCTECRERES